MTIQTFESANNSGPNEPKLKVALPSRDFNNVPQSPSVTSCNLCDHTSKCYKPRFCHNNAPNRRQFNFKTVIPKDLNFSKDQFKELRTGALVISSTGSGSINDHGTSTNSGSNHQNNNGSRDNSGDDGVTDPNGDPILNITQEPLFTPTLFMAGMSALLVWRLIRV